MTTTENLFPDLHQKMSKKIAQLTKVIYHLNYKNEEHNDDLSSLADAYETEIDGILKDAYTKVQDTRTHAHTMRLVAPSHAWPSAATARLHAHTESGAGLR